eukprot:scaffold9408_cov35-Tisochrysis_lutea.AAC.2
MRVTEAGRPHPKPDASRSLADREHCFERDSSPLHRGQAGLCAQYTTSHCPMGRGADCAPLAPPEYVPSRRYVPLTNATPAPWTTSACGPRWRGAVLCRFDTAGFREVSEAAGSDSREEDVTDVMGGSSV